MCIGTSWSTARYHWYSDLTLIPTHPTLTEHMYPFTPLELHEGFLIGQEHIITKRSGLFGWGDSSAHEVYVYDEAGREVRDIQVPWVTRGQATFSELRLAAGWSAVIVRRSHGPEPAPPDAGSPPLP